MSRFFARWRLLVGLSGAALLGCESAARRPYADDPLLMDRKPVVTKAAAAGAGPLAPTEPPPPTPPITTLASAAAPEEPTPVPPAPDAAKLPVPATPVARTKPPRALPTSPPIRRQVPETYGHAADYAWLQGILDRHYRGSLDLRYCDPSVEDRWGGKVTLADDPRLAPFHDGDLILVEGELVQDSKPPDARRRYPTYRVREVWLVQRASEARPDH